MARTGRRKKEDPESPATQEEDSVFVAGSEGAPVETVDVTSDPSGGADLPPDSVPSPGSDLRSRLTEVLSVPRSKGAVPVLASYKMNFFERYFILDLDPSAFRKAWEIYKETEGNNPVGFVQAVINILEMDFPRMYRAVAYIPLV